MTSHPSRSYTLKTSSARPTPCVPSTVIVRTLYVATVISHPRARARFLVLLSRRRRRSALRRRLRLRVSDLYYPPFPAAVLALYFGLATWVQPSHPASPCPPFVSGTNLVLTNSLLSPLASFGTITVGTNGLTCGFNWQCTVNAIGYAAMATARLDSFPSPHFHSLGPPRPGGSRGVHINEYSRRQLNAIGTQIRDPISSGLTRLRVYSKNIRFS